MIHFTYLIPNAEAYLGAIPFFLNPENPSSAAEQFNRHYAHGGGWQPFTGFTLNPDNSIKYPGDEKLKPLALAKFRDELICIYPHAWVAVIQPDRSFEISRMD